MKIAKNNLEKIRFVILLLLVASLPFQYFASSILIIAGVLLSLLIVYNLRQFNLRNLDALSIAFILYFILEVVGLVYTERENITTGLFVLEKHQAFLFLPLFFFGFNIDNKRKTLLSIFVASCFVASLICLGVNIYLSLNTYNMIFHEWIFSHDRMSDPIGMQAVYFALYLGFVLLILVFELKEKFALFSPMKKTLFILLILYFSIFMITLGARTVIVAVMLIIVLDLIYYAVSLKSYRLFLLGAIVPLIFSAVIFLNPVVRTRFMDMYQNRYENSNYGSYFARSMIWIPGWEAIEENVWVGVGTGDYQMELDKKFVKYDFLFGVQFMNMHNQYLQTMLSFGVIGLSIFSVIFFVQFKAGLARGDLQYLSFLLLFMCACLTESMLNRNKGIVFLLVFSFIFYKTNVVSKEQI